MAQQFLTSINLNSNELQNALLHPLATAPAVGAAGKVYYNTSENIVYVSDGAAWRSISGDITSVTAGAGLTGDATIGDVTIDVVGGNGITVNADNIELNTEGSQFSFPSGVLTISTDAIGPDELAPTSVTAGSYGSETAIPTFTVDTEGRLTAAGTVSISTVLNVAADAGTGDGVELSTDTLLVSGGTNINTSIAGDEVTINLNDTVSLAGDLTVSGNLTVSGTTTTVNTETISLADNVILLNSNATGSPTENAGIEVERGDSDNAELIWNESTDKWQIEVDPANDTYENIATEEFISRNSLATTITGDGVENVFAINHTFNTRDLSIQLYDSTTFETVFADVVRTNLSTVTISFASPPETGQDYRVLINKIG
jgi:hypothetical protein